MKRAFQLALLVMSERRRRRSSGYGATGNTLYDKKGVAKHKD